LILALVNLPHSPASNQAAHFEPGRDDLARRKEVLIRLRGDEPLATAVLREDSARAIVLAKEFFYLGA
jgi:hypothetical protein